jgi:hypothetical protein
LATRDLAELCEEISLHPPSSTGDRQKLAREAYRLRADLSRLAALSAQGTDFCRKWSHAMHSAALSARGYLPNGESESPSPPATILLRG